MKKTRRMEKNEGREKKETGSSLRWCPPPPPPEQGWDGTATLASITS